MDGLEFKDMSDNDNDNDYDYDNIDDILDSTDVDDSDFVDNNDNKKGFVAKAHNFALTDDEKDELSGKIKDLRDFCNMHKIPFFIAAAYEDSKLDTKYMYEALTAYDTNRQLKKDNIAQLLLIKNGFKAVPRQNFEKIS